MKALTPLAAATLLGIAASAAAAAEPQKAAVDAAPASATHASSSIDPRFAAMDKDGDGSLLQGDMPAGHDLGTDLFSAFDIDKDQRISRAEFAVYAGGPDDSAEGEEEEEAE